MRPITFHSDRSWRFDVGRDRLWDRITTTDEYTQWWPWLQAFEPDGGVVPGQRWTCTVAPPLPYRVRFEVHFVDVVPGHHVESTVSGDIGGHARLTIDDDGDGTRARLVSDLHPTNRLLRGFGLVARPLVEYGHNWILDEGRRQFAERAFPIPPTTTEG